MTLEPPTPVRIAAWWRRAVAIGIDGALTLACAILGADRFGPHDVLQRGDGFLLWWIALGAVYVTVLSGAKRGQTIGKMLLGIRVARLDGVSIGYARAFLRWLVTGALWMFGLWIGGIIDSLVALIDPRRRTIHDMLVGSVVLRAQS